MIYNDITITLVLLILFAQLISLLLLIMTDALILMIPQFSRFTGITEFLIIVILLISLRKLIYCFTDSSDITDLGILGTYLTFFHQRWNIIPVNYSMFTPCFFLMLSFRSYQKNINENMQSIQKHAINTINNL